MATKKTSFSATIVSSESHPAQLFKVFCDVITSKFDPSRIENLASSYDVFARMFADKISLIHSNLKVKLRTDPVPVCLLILWYG